MELKKGIINMKKKQIKCLSALLLLSFGLGLTSCGDENKSSSKNEEPSSSVVKSSEVPASSSETPSSSSEEIDGNFDLWTEEQKELIKKYCGSLLPYPAEYFSDKVTVREIHDDIYDYSYLEIYDDSKSFTLEEYYKKLAKFAWSPIKTFNGKYVQKDASNRDFVELTKCSKDGQNGYDMIYYYESEISDGDSATSGNLIRCFNDLAGKVSSDTEWKEDEKETIKEFVAFDLPYAHLSDKRVISSIDDNSISILDYYAKNLTVDYYNILTENGFVLDRINSLSYDSYVVSKTLDDGTKITIMLYYYSGNNIQVYYTPKILECASWPSEIISTIKKESGVDLPAFEIADGGNYRYYRKNDSFYIFTNNLKDDYNYETYNNNILQDPSLTWEETISLASYNLVEDDPDTVVGFMVVASLKKPTSTFVDVFPTSTVTSTITDLLKITGVDLPSFDNISIPETGKKVKYSVLGESYFKQRYDYYYQDVKQWPEMYGFNENASEDDIKQTAEFLASKEMGISVSAFDKNESFAEAAIELLTNACWYKYSDESGIVFEDPTGKLAITISTLSDPSHDYEGETKLYIHPGAGEAREAEFYFLSDEINVGIGQTKDLELIVNMLPYEVTYSSSDTTGGISVNEKGEVTIKEDVAVGTTATITASMNVPGESKPRTTTCTVTASDILVYSPASTITKLADTLKGLGYEPVVNYSTAIDELDNLKLNLGSSTSKGDAKTLVSEHLVLKGFELGDSWESGTIYVGSQEKDGDTINSSIYNDACYVIVEYDLYEENGDLILYISAY